jgi:hypothetical protein
MFHASYQSFHANTQVRRQRARHAVCAGRTLRGDCALYVRWARSVRAPDGMDRPKAAFLGQLAGFGPSRPLWLWATLRPEGIVDFSIFHGFICMKLKSISV